MHFGEKYLLVLASVGGEKILILCKIYTPVMYLRTGAENVASFFSSGFTALAYSY